MGSPGGWQRSGAQFLKDILLFFGSLSPNQIDGNTLEVTHRAGWWESPIGPDLLWSDAIVMVPRTWKVYAWASDKQVASSLVEAH